jgi:hypothetical protein
MGNQNGAVEWRKGFGVFSRSDRVINYQNAVR